MSDDILIFDSVTSSNMTPREKSKVLTLLETAMPKETRPQTVLALLVESTVAGTTGAVLGTLQAELKDGLDYNNKYPIDLVLAALSKAGGRIYSSSLSREVGNVAIGIYSFRKTEALLSSLKPKEQKESEPVAAE